MFWFGRPSYLRWVAAGLLLGGAAVVEFWPTNLAPYPFAAEAVAAGDPIPIEFRELPSGIYPRANVDGKVAAHPLAAGEPIRPSDLIDPPGVPRGWWALALEVPAQLAPGTETRIVLANSDRDPVPGIVVDSREADPFSVGGPTALVAVPAEHITEVATAAAARQVVVLIGR